MKEKFCLIFGGVVFLISIILILFGQVGLGLLLLPIGFLFILNVLIKNRIFYWVIVFITIIFYVLIHTYNYTPSISTVEVNEIITTD